MSSRLSKLAHKFAQMLGQPTSDMETPQKNDATYVSSGFKTPMPRLQREDMLNLQANKFWLMPLDVLQSLTMSDQFNGTWGSKAAAVSRHLQQVYQKLCNDEGQWVDAQGVAKVQQALKLTPNGQWGFDCSKALQAFQSSNGLSVTGTMTKETGMALGVVV